jgi:hypothetical protein
MVLMVVLELGSRVEPPVGLDGEPPPRVQVRCWDMVGVGLVKRSEEKPTGSGGSACIGRRAAGVVPEGGVLV